MLLFFCPLHTLCHLLIPAAWSIFWTMVLIHPWSTQRVTVLFTMQLTMATNRTWSWWVLPPSLELVVSADDSISHVTEKYLEAINVFTKWVMEILNYWIYVEFCFEFLCWVFSMFCKIPLHYILKANICSPRYIEPNSFIHLMLTIRTRLVYASA